MRKLFFYTITGIFCAVILIAGSYHFYFKSRIKEQLKTIIINQLNTNLSGSVNLADMKVGISKLSLKNVLINYHDEQYILNIPGIEIRYSLLDLYKQKNALNAITDIKFIEPLLKINLDQDTMQSSLEFYPETNKTVKKLTEIHKIKIQNGSVIIQIDSTENRIARGLDGAIESLSDSKLGLHIAGRLLCKDENFGLEGYIDLNQNNFESVIEINDYHINDPKFFNAGGSYFSEANIDGTLHLNVPDLNRPYLNIKGQLNLNNIKSHIYQEKIHINKAQLTVSENELWMKSDKNYINDSQFSLSIHIKNIFKPRIHAQLRSDAFDFNSIAAIKEKLNFDKVYGDIKMKFNLNPFTKKIDSRITSELLHVNNIVVENFSTFINKLDNNINLKDMYFSINDYTFHSDNYLNVTTGNYKSRLTIQNQFGEHKFFDKVSDQKHNIVVITDGNFFDRNMQGNWTYTNSNLFNASGKLSIRDNTLDIKTLSASTTDFYASAQIANIFERPVINYSYFENIPFDQFTSKNWFTDLVNTYNFDGIVIGAFDDLSAQINVYRTKLSPDQFIIKAQISNILNRNIEATGTIGYGDFIADIGVKSTYNDLLIDVNSGDNINGDIKVEILKEESFSGYLNFNNFNISPFFNNNYTGSENAVNGQIKLGGNIDNPWIKAELQGDKFIFNESGYYKFDTRFFASTDTLDVHKFSIYLNNSPILQGKLASNLANQSFFAEFNGNDIVSNNILSAFLPDYKNYISGVFNYSVNIGGKFSEFNAAGNFTFKDGAMIDADFDRFDIFFDNRIYFNSAENRYKVKDMTFDKIEVVKNGMYHIDAKGYIPFNNDQQIDFDTNFYGDAFAFLPDLTSVIKEGASFATINLNFNGHLNDININKGYVKIEKGELWLSDVAEHIDKIYGELIIEEGTKKVNLKDFVLSVDDRRLVINTIHDIRLQNGQKLRPWYISEIDLNFGILVFETPDEGVEVRIPALMMAEETGFIGLSGKNHNDDFYFAGPVEHPKMYGTITISDSRITYPFPPINKKGKRKAVVEFLRNVDWDVHVKPGRDLKYIRKMPSLISEVDTELDIDPTSSGLEFKGILSENTFVPYGKLESDRGRLEYLDLNFRVEKFGIEFNKIEQKPLIYGRAWTAVRDSTGAVPKTIYMDLYAVDPVTGQEVQRARWEDFRFKLVSADPTIGETQEQVLAYLGYSQQNFMIKATQVGGAVTEKYLIRPLLRPVERTLEKYLGLDLVRFNSNIARNLFYVSTGQNYNKLRNYKNTLVNQGSNMPYLFLFQSSEFTVGKYVSKDLYFTYTGQLIATSIEKTNYFNLNHSLGLEYRFFKNILLELEYDREMLNYYNLYSDQTYLEDFKIRLRHSFSF